MDPVTRRSFLIKGSAGAVGAAGLAAGGLALSSAAAADSKEPELRPDEAADVGPVLVDIKDAATGEVEILVGEREVSFTDKALVAKVLRAAR
jgi:CHASE2 domain-containing sensor protein